MTGKSPGPTFAKGFGGQASRATTSRETRPKNGTAPDVAEYVRYGALLRNWALKSPSMLMGLWVSEKVQWNQHDEGGNCTVGVEKFPLRADIIALR